MLTANLVGGLGNQLFIIFNVISQAIKKNQPFCFIKTDTLGGEYCTKRNTYWNTLFAALQPHLVNTYVGQSTHQYKESAFHYTPIFINYFLHGECLPILYIFDGYFQSYKYFENEFIQICDMIDLKKFHAISQEWIIENGLYFDNTISMHFRVGDYKAIQDSHPVLNYQYYKNSLDYIYTIRQDSSTILYFFEKGDADDVLPIIMRLIADFPRCKFCSIHDYTPVPDYMEMLIMSQCNHNIIANSSFSWWGAYLNQNHNKIVCYPDVWFGPRIDANTRDLFPASWLKTSVN